MFVHEKESDDVSVIKKNSKIDKLRSLIVPSLDSIPLMFYPKREKRMFSVGCLSSTEIKEASRELDVLNLHWISGGFLSVRSISQISKPLVLTLHDSWAFTGGCHVPFQCEKFVDKCGACIQLQSDSKLDLSTRLWKNKYELLSKKNIVLVGDGNWVADNARRSSIFRNHRVEVVHPGLDLNVYKPVGKKSSREILGVEERDKVILFGAFNATSDSNKGFHLLVPALKKLSIISFVLSSLPLHWITQ
jgi:glycosyltransferase involved in cell wall biosynthesis